MLDVIRGKHSTGVASLNGLGNFKVAKSGLNAVDFMDQKHFEDLMRPVQKILMGHNRHATVGAINDENAHPFEFDNIIGAHNGSLYKGTWEKFGKYNVDSQALYSEMDNKGVEALWKQLQGAAALTWIDKRDKTLHFLRNSQRPLFYATMNGGKTLIWASEDWMLYVAAGREGVKLDGKPHELPVNNHMTFTLPAKFGDQVTWESEVVEAYVAPKYTYTSNRSYDYYSNGADDEAYEASKALAKKHLDVEGATVGDVIEFSVDLIRDYMDNGRGKANVMATSLRGTPVRMWSVDADYYAALLQDMNILKDAVFSGKIRLATETGLIIDHLSVCNTGLTLDTYIEAEDFSKLEEHDNKVAAAEEVVSLGRPITTTGYSVSCSDCRKLVSSYHMMEGHRFCHKCATAFKKKAAEKHIH
jgi:hypothetical protein